MPHETFWHMVKHFLYDITHFDGNFFNTIRYLVWKPGFLSKEYTKGRRASYLHPVKMYVFTSAMFFLLFFGFFAPTGAINTNMNAPLTPERKAAYIKKLESKIRKDTGNSVLKGKLIVAKDSTQLVTEKDMLSLTDSGYRIISFSGTNYRDKAEYDSLQQVLPKSERDGWLMRRIMKKEFEINDKYRDNPDEAFNKLADSIFHRLPYMLFVSLPLFALLLKLVYIRRKQFFYADHGIFTIHLYVFSFLLLLLVFSVDKLQGLTGWAFLGTVIVLLFLLLLFYLYKAMRNFYGQRRGKTLIKFFLVSLFSIIMMLLLFAIFAFFSAFTF